MEQNTRILENDIRPENTKKKVAELLMIDRDKGEKS